MEVALVPASTLSADALAALFTAVYEGYWHPIRVDAPALERMVATYGLDLESSRVALDPDGDAVGVALLALRGRQGWVGGMGVLPARRGEGLGARLTSALLEAARERGAETVRLEVLEQNAPAIAVYRRLGFAHRRDVAVWLLSAPPPGARAAADEADLSAALAELDAAGLDPPWQRSLATVAALRAAGEELRAVRAGHGVAVFHRAEGRWAVLELTAPDAASADSLLQAPFAAGASDLLWLNGPVEGAAADALGRAGAARLALQHELRVAL